MMKNGYLGAGVDVVKFGEEEQIFFFFFKIKNRGAELRKKEFLFIFYLYPNGPNLFYR